MYFCWGLLCAAGVCWDFVGRGGATDLCAFEVVVLVPSPLHIV